MPYTANQAITYLNNKADVDLANLENISPSGNTFKSLMDAVLSNMFTIVYPEGGTADNPATITKNSQYIIENPFPGYYVDAQVEIQYNNEWVAIGIHNYYSSGHYGSGAYVYQHNGGDLVMKTGTHYLLANNGSNDKNNYINTTIGSVTTSTTLPCRVKVWKIGKIEDN